MTQTWARTKKISIVFAVASMLILTGCGKSAFVDISKTQTPVEKVQPDLPRDSFEIQITDEEPRSENDQPDHDADSPKLPLLPEPSSEPVAQTSKQFVQIKVESETRLRTLKDKVLEPIYTLVAGDIIQIDKNLQPVSYNYRTESGKLEFASTGFYPQVQIIKAHLSDEEIKKLNDTSSGLFVTSIVVSGSQLDASNTFPPLVSKSAGVGYLRFFEENGKPKNAYTKISAKRFSNINKGVAWSSLSINEQKKWSAIMGELERVADRTRKTERDLLVIDRQTAMKIAVDFEKNEVVQGKGAWSVAVDGTAKRNGFEDVPCAEFMGEVIRQAYFRAGYRHQDDFNKSKGNTLNYDNGASAVVYLSAYLAKAGWVPWNSQQYVPPIGAVMMHKNGTSPGHTYMSAGSNGRFIIDNSSPQGRDLRGASEKAIADMYQTGIFFLPPGFIPQTWEQLSL